MWKNCETEVAVEVWVGTGIQLRVPLAGPDPFLHLLQLFPFLDVVLLHLYAFLTGFIEYPVDELNIFLQQLDGLGEKFIAFL